MRFLLGALLAVVLGAAELTPTNVGGAKFLGSYHVDGPVWSQPLVAEGVLVGTTFRTLLVTCTMNDSCYGFDATQLGSNPLWHTSLGTPRTNYPVNGGNIFFGNPVGCLSTPTIDSYTWMLYVVCGNSTPAWTLYQIYLPTGSVVNSIVLSGQVPGTGTTGDRVVGGQLQFYPDFALARAGLVLANGNIYVSMSSYGDYPPFHGWMFAYAESNLSLVSLICTTPLGSGGSIWQSGASPVVDPQGNLYVLTGNGDYNGLTNWADSLLKLSPTLQILDWFTPSNYAALESGDLDLSSSHPILVPGQGLITFSFKDANIYSVSTGCLGHIQGSGSCGLQKFPTNISLGGQDSGVYSGATYGNGVAYFGVIGGPIYEFGLTSSGWNTTPTLVGSTTYTFPGATMTLAKGLLWVMGGASDEETGTTQGTLYALNPTTLTSLWSTPVGTMAKFMPPTVSNGMVYIPTLDSVVKVYGLGVGVGNTTLRNSTVRHGVLR